MSYQYDQEAKERISALGQAALTELFEEIPQSLRRPAYRCLPRIQGFRPDSPAEFKEKQKRLIGHLIHPPAGSRGTSDWRVFSQLWEVWARDRLGKEFPPGDNFEFSSEAGPAFLKELAERFPDAAREEIERLFIFSGFPDHPDVAEALERFRPASTIAHDRMIEGLPVRMDDIEGRLGVAETASADAVKRIEQLEIASAGLDTEAKSAARSIDQNSSAISELRVALDAESTHACAIEKVVDALDNESKKIAEAVLAADSRADDLEQSLQALVTRREEWDGAITEIVALKEDVAGLLVRETDWARASEAVSVLAERVTALENILAGGNAGSGSGAGQRGRLLENKQEGPFVDIASVEGACALIASNLQAVGVMKGAAVDAARLVVGAFIAGQIVQFSGSLADFVADAVAAAVGGQTYSEWRVPVGLVSHEVASDCIETAAESSDCLRLKGANLSAFEVYGSAIRDVVVRRQFSANSFGRLALVASWARGAAVFPDGGTLAELGPVFDTDTFRMRGVSAKLPQMKFGRLAKDAWSEIVDRDDAASTPAENGLSELLKEAGFEGGGLWRRVTSQAYAILRSIPGGTPEGDLYSLLILWAIPWAKATGGPAKEIAQIAERELAEWRTETTL